MARPVMLISKKLSGLGAATTLPSVAAAEDFFNGKPGGLSSVLLSTGLRAGLIGAGLYVAGERQRLLRYSIAGALAIEAFVLLYIRAQMGPNTFSGLRAAQIKFVNERIEGWKGSEGFDQYLGLSRRGLGAFLPSDFMDAGAVAKWVDERVTQAALESGIPPTDAAFREVATAFANQVVAALKDAAAQTCRDRADLCGRLDAAITS
jgi:hypothetical protein